MEAGSTAVIMVGGPTKGTRFRPLSMNRAKPIFPIAGLPMTAHPILACKKIPNLMQVLLIGFYKETEMRSLDFASLSRELQVPVTYLEESEAHGSAGGLYHFKEKILTGNPAYIFVLNCDVCSEFPLEELLSCHRAHSGIITVMAKTVPQDKTREHGVVVADQATGELLHYVERPETLVNTTVNCGVYVFSSEKMMELIKEVMSQTLLEREEEGTSPCTSPDGKGQAVMDVPVGMPEVFKAVAANKKAYVYETTGFWEVLKTPGMSLKFSELYLQGVGSSLARARSRLNGGPTIEGNVFIHPSAEVHPSAKIGPNVAIGDGCVIKEGVRLHDCIVLDNVVIGAHSCALHAIVGWNSVIGQWVRIQGVPDYEHKNAVTILAEGVEVADELVIISSVVLPHKEIKGSVRDSIIL